MITDNIYIWVDTKEQKNKVKNILKILGNKIDGDESFNEGGTWAIYHSGDSIYRNHSKGGLTPEISYQEFLNKYGGEREFKVGDVVRIIGSHYSDGDIYEDTVDWIGRICTIQEINNSLLPIRVKWGGKEMGFVKLDIELVQPAQEEVKYPMLGKVMQELIVEELYKSKSLDDIDYPRDGKVNGVKKVMSNIVEFAKNLTLSQDEKLLREVGLKDECGNFTENARQVVLDLEAVELGFKSYEHLQTKVGVDSETSLEFARLLVKHEAKLLEIAKAKKEEEKK